MYNKNRVLVMDFDLSAAFHLVFYDYIVHIQKKFGVVGKINVV